MVLISTLNRRLLTLVAFSTLTAPGGLLTSAAAAQTPPLTPDIPAKYETPTSSYDYVRREVMIPMRDGVKLHTVIVVPRGARHAPVILTRTPYDAASRTGRSQSPHMLAVLPQGD